ncbi:tRNA glutamyl-Q(34) synthetase GluQRS [Geothrix sp. PMB-07]|uniref:tRNA glutamyl-Q(34) synthetase GluQRS n=1 Tax=Geothrix sp. PMB-07 TaxID=3068640 RepID=UPI002740A87A|nr:tRNA glutamyl-Q(34) synthetase GluQRS [Geothrix sp. PMB-07]WLT32142.1 tRNA glutamyl-Q(34) synthetase GluQRS [Geothrix sp. PMB-07]
MSITGRFAPSPTGILHLGNLRTALASWLSVRKAGGRWLIRVEDVDGPRCHRDLGDAQLRDLERLGLVSDEPVVWQSERSAHYREALASLHRAHLLYPCACTRKDLQLLASAPHAEDGLRPYPGRCRFRAWEGFERALRFQLSDGVILWEDRLLGAQSDDPALLTGDPLLFRRDGCFAYHLAVVVDDGAQGVDEVVRGADLRPVTATQIRLQEALGLPTPAYAHLGMVLAPDGGRLGKRAGALGIEALADRGVAVPDLLGWLGWSLGCLSEAKPCQVEELIAGFDWSRVPKGDVRVPPVWG